MPIITKFGDGGVFWIALAVIFLIFKKTRKMGLCMGLALLMGFITGNLILKNVVGRIRPYDLNPEIEILVKHLSDYSFPSGHTLASFEAATAIFINNKKIGIPALVLAFLIAISRIYLYVHYPSDVLAAIILGIGFAILSCLIVKKYQDKIPYLN
ncbi:MAG: phosphatase PAP2 family protein [Clostridia bacterium]|nr:phosphatase PAP2 family protein [Clostridia bacterium]